MPPVLWLRIHSPPNVTAPNLRDRVKRDFLENILRNNKGIYLGPRNSFRRFAPHSDRKNLNLLGSFWATVTAADVYVSGIFINA
jgi:hypothetical protein